MRVPRGTVSTKPRITITRQRARCPQCGKDLAVQVPKGGDGSVDVFPRHRDKNGDRCSMGRNEVRVQSYL